jgi:mRNA interferase RelE/StbE
MYKLVPTKEFAKGLKRLSQSEKKQVKNRLELLKDNPGHPSLRTKRLAGTNIFESSASMGIRILWNYSRETQQMIILLAVGSSPNLCVNSLGQKKLSEYVLL